MSWKIYLKVADALSRVGNAPLEETIDLQYKVCSVVNNLPMSERAFKEFQEETKSDGVLELLLKYMQQGWPEKRSIQKSVMPYHSIKSEIWEDQGLIFKGEQVVVPTSLRKKMKKLVHEGHLGIVKCKLRARTSFFWPSMSKEIEDIVRECDMCQKHQKMQQKEPLMSHDCGPEPFYKVGIDLFSFYGHKYLVIIDYYSNYPEVCYLKDETAQTVIQKMKAAFARFGIPKQVITDGAPQFTGREFREFVSKWDFDHLRSSPYYPRSNGLAERTVQTIKLLFKKAHEKNEDPYLALLAHRSTPLGPNELSPAKMLMNREIRTKISTCTVRKELRNCPRRKLDGDHENGKYYNQHAKVLKPLQSNQTVRIYDSTSKTWKMKGKVEKEVSPRSYRIQAENGKMYIRNRQQIRPTNECFNRNPEYVIDDSPQRSEESRPVPEAVPELEEGPRNVIETFHQVPVSRYGRPLVKPDRFMP